MKNKLKVYELRKSGESWQSIAKTVGRSTATVHRWYLQFKAYNGFSVRVANILERAGIDPSDKDSIIELVKSGQILKLKNSGTKCMLEICDRFGIDRPTINANQKRPHVAYYCPHCDHRITIKKLVSVNVQCNHKAPEINPQKNKI